MQDWQSVGNDGRVGNYRTGEPFGPGAGHLQFSTPFMYNVNILWTKKGNIRKYATFCGGINEDGESLKK